MSRPGITYDDVAQAALNIQMNGETPTIDKIRAALGGTGSNTTILKYLSLWRSHSHVTQETPVKPGNTPPDIVKAAVDRVWQQMREQTDAEIEAIKNHSLQQIASADAKADTAEANRINTQTEYQQLQETFQALSAEKELLWLDLKRLHEEHAQLTEQHQVLNTRYKDMESGLTRHLRELAETHQQELTRMDAQQQTLQQAQQQLVSTITEQHEKMRQQMMVEIDALKVINQKEQKIQQTLRVELQDKAVTATQLQTTLQLTEKNLEQQQQQLRDQQQQIQQIQNKTLVADELLSRMTDMPKFNVLLEKLEAHYLQAMQFKMTALDAAIDAMKCEKVEMLNA